MPKLTARSVKLSVRSTFALVCCLFVGCGTSATQSVTQVTAPSKKPAEKESEATESVSAKPAVKPHEVRKEVTAVDQAKIPQVFLTSDHSAMCRVRTGDQLPAISLPKVGGGEAELASLGGKKATVVLFWQEDPWMSEVALKDLSSDVQVSDDVAVVGIAVKQPANAVEAAVEETGAGFTQLLDSDGKAFNQVGMTKLPRVYVLDGSGKIAWFDIEYSQSTQRELKKTLEMLTNK